MGGSGLIKKILDPIYQTNIRFCDRISWWRDSILTELNSSTEKHQYTFRSPQGVVPFGQQIAVLVGGCQTIFRRHQNVRKVQRISILSGSSLPRPTPRPVSSRKARQDPTVWLNRKPQSSVQVAQCCKRSQARRRLKYERKKTAPTKKIFYRKSTAFYSVSVRPHWKKSAALYNPSCMLEYNVVSRSHVCIKLFLYSKNEEMLRDQIQTTKQRIALFHSR